MPKLPPTSLVLLAIASAQLGSAIAKSLFQSLDPTGVVVLRLGFAAITLMLLWRPQIKASFRAHYRPLILFGLALAFMNISFYQAIARIPLGIAVTLEFIGPLGVAIANSRKWLDAVWVLLAAAGIILLAPVGERVFDPAGIALALLSGGFWAAYILLSARVGQVLAGGTGLALSMAIGAMVLFPVGVATSGAALLNPHVLLMGFGVALLSSAIPYSLELEALRSLPVQVFGVLLSLEPAAGALMGFLVLGETLNLRAMIALLFVTIAAAGASKFASRKEPVP